MYRNTTKNMAFSQGDLMIRQSYMPEARAMVWEIFEYRPCGGPYADRGDHAWLLYGDRYIEPFATREDALEYLYGLQ